MSGMNAKLISENSGKTYVVAIHILDPRGNRIWCDVYSSTSREAAERTIARNDWVVVARETR